MLDSLVKLSFEGSNGVIFSLNYARFDKKIMKNNLKCGDH